MKYSQYKYSFYLNASHSIYMDGKPGDRHPHTWQISIYMINLQDEMVLFNEVEKRIETLLDKYQEKFINDYPPFTTLNPTLENLAQYFLTEIQNILTPMNWIVYTIEISETPTRSYIISILENNIVEEVERKNIALEIIKAAQSKDSKK